MSASPAVAWTSGDASLLLSLHTLEDASSAHFWQRIATRINQRGKDAAECQRKYMQLCCIASPPPAAKRKRAAASGRTQADDTDSVSVSEKATSNKHARKGASISSPASGVASPAPRPRLQKPTLRQLFEQHRNATAAAAANDAAAHVDSDDDFFGTGPSPLKRARTAAAEEAHADTSEDSEEEEEQAAEKAAALKATAAKQGAAESTSVTRRTRSGRVASSKAAVSSKRALLQQLRKHIARDDDASSSTKDVTTAGTVATPVNAVGSVSPSSLLAVRAERDKTDAYVRVFQRTSKLTVGVPGVKRGKAAPKAAGARGKALPTTVSSAAALSLVSSSASAARAALRERDAHARQRSERAGAADDTSDDDQHAPLLGVGGPDGDD